MTPTRSRTIGWMASSLAVLGILLAASSLEAAPLLGDNFNRADSTSLGATPIGGYAWDERSTLGAALDVASIVSNELYLHGGGSGHAIVAVNQADLAVSADLRFFHSSPPSTGATATKSLGLMARLSDNSATYFYSPNKGLVSVQMLPNGAFWVAEQKGSPTSIATLYMDNPFAPGTSVQQFQAPGTLPTTINGKPFDANGNGILDNNEPFRLGLVANGNTIQVEINGRTMLGFALSESTGVSANRISLIRNNFGGSGIDSVGYWDNLTAETPGYVIRHRGDTNPLLENWTLDQTGAAGTFTPGDDGTKHWRITQVAGQRANYQTVLLPEKLNDPAGWTATAVAKVNSASPFNAELAVADGSHFWGVELGGGPGVTNVGVFAVVASGNNLRLLSTADPSTDYHTYQMVYYRPATQTVSFYRDGVGIGTQGRSELIPTSLRRLSWGDNTGGFGASDSQWAFTQFQVGQTAMTGTVLEHRATANPVTEGFTFSSNGPQHRGAQRRRSGVADPAGTGGTGLVSRRTGCLELRASIGLDTDRPAQSQQRRPRVPGLPQRRRQRG